MYLSLICESGAYALMNRNLRRIQCRQTEEAAPTMVGVSNDKLNATEKKKMNRDVRKAAVERAAKAEAAVIKNTNAQCH